MNLKDILVHIDHRPTCDARLKLAIALAREQKAHLTGLYVIPHPHLTTHQVEEKSKSVKAQEKFKQAVSAAGLESEWICVDGLESGLDLTHALNLYAHYRDLLVVSQTDPDALDRIIPSDLPERAVLGSGRPVLIVPYAGDFSTLGKRVLLAWRGGPESSRALHDAMPLLMRAETLRVISVQGSGGDEAYRAHDADICKHLVRYDLPVACEKLNAGGLSIGDMLLNRAADQGCDLLVMGAFSQSRRGHQTLGEVGRYMLQYMTLPVLMSH